MIDMKENLMIIKEKVMVYTIQMEIDMKANGKMIKKMDMELIIGLMEINMKGNLKEVYQKVMEYIIIQVE